VQAGVSDATKCPAAVERRAVAHGVRVGKGIEAHRNNEKMGEWALGVGGFRAYAYSQEKETTNYTNEH
jgi:NADPH-dependent curcumin reductase CurA